MSYIHDSHFSLIRKYCQLARADKFPAEWTTIVFRGNIPISVVCKMLVEYDPNQNQVLKLTLSEREEFLAGRKRQSLRSRR